MGEEVVYLDDKGLKRHELVDRIQLAVAALALVMVSLERLRHPGPRDLVLATLQLLTSLVVIGSVVVWVRTRSAPSTARVGWLDLLAGLMLLIEWADRYLESGRVFTPALCQAAVFITLGLLHTRLATWRRGVRFVRVDDDGITMRRSLVRKRYVSWTDVASVSRDLTAIRVVRSDGRVWRVRLSRFENADEVARLILDAAAVRGLAADDRIA